MSLKLSHFLKFTKLLKSKRYYTVVYTAKNNDKHLQSSRSVYSLYLTYNFYSVIVLYVNSWIHSRFPLRCVNSFRVVPVRYNPFSDFINIQLYKYTSKQLSAAQNEMAFILNIDLSANLTYFQCLVDDIHCKMTMSLP